jgi:hypothetical protein
MTLEEIEGLTPEQLDKIKSVVQYTIENEKKGVLSKNAELIAKLEKQNVTRSELERLKALEDSVKQKEQEDQKNYQAALALRDEAHQKTLQELNERTAKYEQKLIEAELLSGLDGIRPELRDAAKAMFMPQIKVADGAPIIAEKPLSEFLGDWKKSDQAKVFLQPVGNGSGSAVGGHFDGDGQPVDTSKMTANQKMELGRAMKQK